MSVSAIINVREHLKGCPQLGFLDVIHVDGRSVVVPCQPLLTCNESGRCNDARVIISRVGKPWRCERGRGRANTFGLLFGPWSFGVGGFPTNSYASPGRVDRPRLRQ